MAVEGVGGEGEVGVRGDLLPDLRLQDEHTRHITLSHTERDVMLITCYTVHVKTELLCLKQSSSD